MSKWFATPYIAENFTYELEATTKEEALRELDDLRSEITVSYDLHEEES